MIIRSTSPDVTVPEVSITEYVLRHAERLGDKPAMVDGPSGRTLTYRQLADGVRRAATGLARRGFKKGDVFAIYSPNLPEYAVAFNAVASLGGVNTTVNPLYTADELVKQLEDSGARFLVTVGPFLDKAREAAARARVEEVFVFGTAGGARPRSPTCSRRRLVRRRWPSTPGATWSCCRTRAARPACPRASCSRTRTSSPTSASASACRTSTASPSRTPSWPCCRTSTSTAWWSS